MAHIKKINERSLFPPVSGTMAKPQQPTGNRITIELQVDDYYLAHSLLDIVEKIEDEDLLDGIYETDAMEVEVRGSHYSGVIRIKK